MKKVRRLFTRLFTSIYNLIYYFKVIWSDRQWDHMYIEYILLAKYKLMYKHMISDNCMASVNQDEYNQALRICINILERRKNDFYTELFHIHYGQYMDFEFIPVDETLGDEKLYELKSKTTSQADLSYHGIKGYHNIIEERDWKIFCKLVEKYHNHWWD